MRASIHPSLPRRPTPPRPPHLRLDALVLLAASPSRSAPRSILDAFPPARAV